MVVTIFSSASGSEIGETSSLCETEGFVIIVVKKKVRNKSYSPLRAKRDRGDVEPQRDRGVENNNKNQM